MGISREGILKRKRTGGQRRAIKKKRLYGMGRPTSATKLAPDKFVKIIRVRGGNRKYRALKLNHGNFVWKSQNFAKKVRILQVLYNAANNEFVRRNLLCKGTVVAIDKTAFENQYKLKWGAHPKDGTSKDGSKPDIEIMKAVDENINKYKGALKRRKASKKAWGCDDEYLQKTFQKREEPLLAMISTRAGQCGRADGYVLEGKELDFYKRKIAERKKGSKSSS